MPISAGPSMALQRSAPIVAVIREDDLCSKYLSAVLDFRRGQPILVT
jgi:hypothetical protein